MTEIKKENYDKAMQKIEFLLDAFKSTKENNLAINELTEIKKLLR